MLILTWISDHLLNIAFVLVAVPAVYFALRVRHLEGVLRDHALQLGAIRERTNVNELDVDRYHERVHPHCAAKGGR